MNRYKIILSNQNVYKEIEIQDNVLKLTVGTSLECNVRLHKDLFFEEFLLTFSKQGDLWIVTCSDNLFLNVGDVRKLLNKSVKHGDVLSVKYQDSDVEAFNIEFLIDFDNESKNYERIINVSNCSNIKIGTNHSCQISLKGHYVNNDLFEFQRNEKGFSVNIINTTYGFYLNGTKTISKCTIKDGDFFSISDFVFYYKDRKIWTEIREDITVNGLTFSDNPIPVNYPKFQRNTRLKSVLNDDEIEILDPPSKPKKNRDNILTSLLPSMGMLMSSGFMALAGGSNMIVFSVITGGMAILTTVVNLVQNKKDFKKEIQDRIDKYTKYSENKDKEIIESRNQERRQLEELFIDTKKEQQRLFCFSEELFDRVPEDDDFLNARLGIGSVKAIRKIKYKKQEKLEIEDDLQLIPQKLFQKYEMLPDAPVVCDFTKCNCIGIIGKESNRYSIFKNIVIDICIRHYPSDVKLFFISEKHHKERIQWLRFLPHVKNEVIDAKNIVVDEDSKNRIFDYLFKEMSFRENEKGYQNEKDYERIVVFFYDEYGFQNHPISKFISKAKELNITFVFMSDAKGNVPLGCDSFIFVDSATKGRVVSAENKEEVTDFEYETIDDATAKKMVEVLAPVYTEEISLEGALTKNISLFEMFNIFDATDIDLESRWNSSKVYQSMAAPIGVTRSGLVYLDLHDKAHGPHGLVAGTTGSGKSELLQTYILSISTLYHPYEVAFVIIDFKGGGMVNQFRNLPHLLGAITNIDGKEIDRSLKSIRAELQKRQRLFSEAGVNHIDKYIKKYKSGEVNIPIPHLVLIVDEFAELRAEQPDFMKELISASRIGRSLGVHLILATQKPHGQVDDQIWSNSRFKLCLKVQNQDDSNEVLKSPLAAEIKEPGRTYFQVGNNEIFELLQSAYSGAPAKTINTNAKDFTIRQINDSGRKVPIYTQKKKKQKGINTTQLDAIVKYVDEFCKDNNIKKLSNICLPPLPKIISYPQKVDIANGLLEIGVYDDPENQIQASTFVDINNKNTLIIGSSQYGKTNLLQSMIRTLANTFTPKEVNIYIIDFGSMVLTNFESLNHVGGVVTSSEDEKLKNLFKLLNTEIAVRKDKLVEVGVSSFSAYLEAGYKDIPRIYLLVDNLTALLELYLQDDDSLMNIIREGISVGITTIITNSQTSGIGYRYITYFANKIVFNCNDVNEYVNLFNRTDIFPDEVPGRCIVEADKRVLECQSYLAFEGEKEIDRVHEMHKFIADSNAKFEDLKAKHILSIPQILSCDMLHKEFGAKTNDYNLPIGLTYADVSPFYLNLTQLGIMGLCGKENTGHKNFINYMIDSLEQNRVKSPSKVVILDDFSRKFSHLKDKDIVDTYTLDCDTVVEILKKWHTILENRYNSMVETGTFGDSNELLLLIIQNNDLAKKINDDWDTMEKFRDIITRFKGMNVAIVFSNFINATVSFDSPEPLRLVKQQQHIIFFEDLNNLKPFDVPYEEFRINKKKLEMGDAYYILDNMVVKLKLVKSDFD